LIRS
jgi:hypothetical protein